MNYYYEDGINVRTNSCTIVGGGGIAYNAVLSVAFSGESGTEPFDLAAAKAWLRVDISDDDSLITALIKAARSVCERYANKSFISRTVTAKIHNGLGNFTLPYGPVVSVTSVKDGDTTLTGYDVSTAYANDLTVVYTAGYTTLPEDIKVAIKNQLAWMYENRGDAALASNISLLSKLTLDTIKDD